MDYNKFQNVNQNSRYKVTGFVTNVPQELTFYVNVHGSQRAEIEKKLQRQDLGLLMAHLNNTQ